MRAASCGGRKERDEHLAGGTPGKSYSRECPPLNSTTCVPPQVHHLPHDLSCLGIVGVGGSQRGSSLCRQLIELARRHALVDTCGHFLGHEDLRPEGVD